MTFEELDLPGPVLEKIGAQGWTGPTPIQQLCIPKILEGRDVLGAAPTGTGKSAAFLLPSLASLLEEPREGISVLVLEPTRELALQVAGIADELCGGLGIKVSAVVGGTSREERGEGLGQIVIATVGRFGEYAHKGWMDLGGVGLLVIDEADRMLDMGFGEEVRGIAQSLGEHQTVLFSATLDGYAVNEFSRQLLRDPVEVRLIPEEDRLPEGLSSRAYYAANEDQKFKILQYLLNTNQEKSIIFVKTKYKVVQLYSRLRAITGEKRDLASLQSGQDQKSRNAALRRFTQSAKGILVATDLAARGLDVADVAMVYNYDLPANGTVYVHRAGRTARAGRTGTVVSLVQRDDLERLERIARFTGAEIKKGALKNISGPFPEGTGAKKSGPRPDNLVSLGKGGVLKRAGDAARKPHTKKRARDQKNIGKPDFAKKRAKRLARAGKSPEND